MQEVAFDFIVNSLNGKIIGQSSPIIRQVVTDSRQNIENNSLFVALQGENFDGHLFVEEAFAKGASAALVSDIRIIDINGLNDKVLIVVEDTLLALQSLAKSYRQLFNIPMVAITGSVGKTTTKELLYSCLSSTYNTLYSEGNYNNDIGVPLTLFNLDKSKEIGIIEVAMRGRGEISRLVDMIRPVCAIITNVELVHLESLASIENIAKAKCEVLEYLRAEDFALINGDQALLVDTASAYPTCLYTFGFKDNCDCQVINVISHNTGMRLYLKVFKEDFVIDFPIPVPKLALNILAAISMAHLLGVPMPKIIKQIESYEPTSNRLHINNLPTGGIVINDTYNANPVSMAAALEATRFLKGNKQSVAVLGDMLELGSYEEKGHLAVGHSVVANDIDILLTIGNRAKDIAVAASEAGMDKTNIHHFNDKTECLNFLRHRLSKTEIVLFKASRGLRLETLIDDWLD
ncbi:MAG: UDP-N-acetylmuramoyl-tripeptide--D-alanyl-D-alanine ligase [Syntrophomonadaceae bacterium]|nr:UDP-N-acetylmuramoyl-tripeptide--D-alanyl-D-alanine ligase [Syntrophomonadaceae bacterium]